MGHKLATEFYSIKECADILGVDYRTIYAHVNSGELKSLRISKGMIKVPKKAFDKWLESKMRNI